MSQTNLEQIRAFFAAKFAQENIEIQSIGQGQALIRWPIQAHHLRPGGTVSGPTMMAASDYAIYIALFTHYGITPMAVTTNLNINFLRKPEGEAALILDASLHKAGRRLAVGEVKIYSEGDPAMVAHATATYAIPKA